MIIAHEIWLSPDKTDFPFWAFQNWLPSHFEHSEGGQNWLSSHFYYSKGSGQNWLPSHWVFWGWTKLTSILFWSFWGRAKLTSILFILRGTKLTSTSSELFWGRIKLTPIPFRAFWGRTKLSSTSSELADKSYFYPILKADKTASTPSWAILRADKTDFHPISGSGQNWLHTTGVILRADKLTSIPFGWTKLTSTPSELFWWRTKLTSTHQMFVGVLGLSQRQILCVQSLLSTFSVAILQSLLSSFLLIWRIFRI